MRNDLGQCLSPIQLPFLSRWVPKGQYGLEVPTICRLEWTYIDIWLGVLLMILADLRASKEIILGTLPEATIK